MLSRNQLFVFAVLFACSLAAFARSTEGTVPFRLYRGYLMVVHGSAGSVRGLNFLLDTGTSPTILDSRLAARLHLERTPESVRAVGGSVEAEQAVVPNLSFGPVAKADTPVIVADLSYLQNALPVHIDAMIGLDIIGDGAFLIDYRSQEIHFGAMPAMPYMVSIRQAGGLAVMNVEVDQIPRSLLLDTGASALTLFTSGAAAARSVRVSQSIGQFEHKDVLLRSLKLGDTEFGRERALLVAGNWPGSFFDGLMNPEMLGMRRVSFDLARGVVGFSR